MARIIPDYIALTNKNNSRVYRDRDGISLRIDFIKGEKKDGKLINFIVADFLSDSEDLEFRRLQFINEHVEWLRSKVKTCPDYDIFEFQELDWKRYEELYEKAIKNAQEYYSLNK